MSSGNCVCVGEQPRTQSLELFSLSNSVIMFQRKEKKCKLLAQATNPRCVTAGERDGKPGPPPPHLPLPGLGWPCAQSPPFRSVLLQMRTVRTDTTTATWWCRRASASTTTTRRPAARPALGWPPGTQASWGADNPALQQEAAGLPTRLSPPPPAAERPRRGPEPSHGCRVASPQTDDPSRGALAPGKVLSESRGWLGVQVALNHLPCQHFLS